MASRERRRAERSKRKARSEERRTQIAARYEEKDRAAREALEPLAEDERPAVVTVAAVISMAIAVLSLAGFVLWEALRDDPRPNATGTISFVIILGAMAYGLYRP